MLWDSIRLYLNVYNSGGGEFKLWNLGYIIFFFRVGTEYKLYILRYRDYKGVLGIYLGRKILIYLVLLLSVFLNVLIGWGKEI